MMCQYLTDFNKFIIANKCSSLTSSNLLDDNYDYDCQLGEVDEDIEKGEFFVERKRLQYFMEASGNDKIDGPFELSSFIPPWGIRP